MMITEKNTGLWKEILFFSVHTHCTHTHT